LDEQQRQRNLEKIKRMCLMDDVFFNICLDDSPECVELILQIIMDEPELKVQRVTTQRTVTNLNYHEKTSDITAKGLFLQICDCD